MSTTEANDEFPFLILKVLYISCPGSVCSLLNRSRARPADMIWKADMGSLPWDVLYLDISHQVQNKKTYQSTSLTTIAWLCRLATQDTLGPFSLSYEKIPFLSLIFPSPVSISFLEDSSCSSECSTGGISTTRLFAEEALSCCAEIAAATPLRSSATGELESLATRVSSSTGFD